MGQVPGLAWWQLVLSIVPILLSLVGGAIGGLIGAAGVFANLSLARKPFGTPVKLLAMVGVVLASYLAFFLVVGLAHNLLKG